MELNPLVEDICKAINPNDKVGYLRGKVVEHLMHNQWEEVINVTLLLLSDSLDKRDSVGHTKFVVAGIRGKEEDSTSAGA